jgi:hypothetical protein
MDGDVQLIPLLADDAAILGQQVVRPERIPMPLADVTGSESAAGFLVGASEVDERSPGAPPTGPPGERLEGDRLGGGEVQHVERAAPHTSPFTNSPPKGSRVQCSGVTGTTSV